MYLVNEIFETVQGEATFTGTPAVFIRMQGCPVGCGWCDTKHTWETNSEDEVEVDEMFAKTEDAPTHAWMTDEMIVQLVKDHHHARHIVLTGGEPCLYDQRPLTGRFADEGYTVQIETSGTHRILVDDRTFVTVSPKVGMPGGYLVRSDAINRANEIKHPLGKLKDLEKLREVLNLRTEDPSNGVWLQPLSQSPKATRLCIEQATLNGWRISVQVHKYLGVR